MSEELKWGCDPHDFADQEAMKRIIADGIWISASEAREMVSQGWHGEGSPTDAIVFRAKHGEVLAKARRWVWIETDHEGVERFERTEQLVPRGFWDDCNLEQDWSHGDFRSETYPDDGKKYEHVLIEVTFEKSGIEALASKAKPVSVAPSMIAVMSTASAERECEAWLRKQFAADPERRKAKASFEAGALAQFGERLSQAGFRRVWAKVAPDDFRTTPGRKS